MSFEITTAARKKVKLKIGFQGPSGAGKTFSALKLAYGLVGDWSKIAVADTENGSALYYADHEYAPGQYMSGWQHINFSPPYHPDRFCEVIDYAISKGAECLIIDSISHEWEGKGGCLDIHGEVERGQKYGNSFTAWKSVTPLHNKFIDTMRIAPIHLLATMRAKQDYVIEQNDKGKAVPKKVGLKGIQREGMDYEMGLVFDINIEHYASVSKDRTNLFADTMPFRITEETGKKLLAWANSGATEVERYGATADQKQVLALLFKEHAITEPAAMKEISEAMMGTDMAGLADAVADYVNNGGL